MKNDTQIVFKNFPLQPSNSIPDKIYLDTLGAYINGHTSGIHSNEGE